MGKFVLFNAIALAYAENEMPFQGFLLHCCENTDLPTRNLKNQLRGEAYQPSPELMDFLFGYEKYQIEKKSGVTWSCPCAMQET